MFKFISKTLHHVSSSAARASPPHNLYFIQSHPCSSSSLKSVQNPADQESFTVNYLRNSCGFSPEKALSAAKYVQFETPEKPDSVLAFFKNHGFNKTQIANIISKFPRLLLSDSEKTLLPKLEFLKSKIPSSTYVAKFVSSSPYVLERSLDKVFIPSFNFLSNFLQGEKNALAAIKRYGGLLLCGHQNLLVTIIEILREAGVPNANIRILLSNQPRVFMASECRFREIVEEVEKMGFDPSRMEFVRAINAIKGMTKSTWEKKVEVYKKWGWTEDDILVAFKKHPGCLKVSEDKINGVMDHFINRMGWKSLFLAKTPVIISMSLEKRIVPRSAVYQALLSKGLVEANMIKLSTLLYYSEMKFLKKVLSYREKEAPELLKLYKQKMDLAK